MNLHRRGFIKKTATLAGGMVLGQHAIRNLGAGEPYALSQFSISDEIAFNQRPFIWTRKGERDTILKRIHSIDWAAHQFEILKKRGDAALTRHQSDRNAFIREAPFKTGAEDPTFLQTSKNGGGGDRELLQKFGEGVDCAVLFYLTEDVNYARCAADILHNSILGYLNVSPFPDIKNGGWIYSNGLLGEAAHSGMYMPVVYDYLYNYLLTSPMVFQMQKTGGKELSYVARDFENAQKVFRAYYELCCKRGLSNNNWSPNMAQSLVPCALALDDVEERHEALKDYLVRDNERQTSLKTDATRYPNPGDIWPETLSYSQGVNKNHSYLMVMLDRYDPSLQLFKQYPNVAQSMARPHQLIFPNGQQIHFGDFHDDRPEHPYFNYELVYGHAQLRDLPNLRELYGPLINAGIAEGKYDRSKYISEIPLPLLWFADTVKESGTDLQIPRTDVLSHAGVALQRNLSTTKNPVDDLMCFVAGGAHVHSHASGMNMELYGKGVVLGVDAGKGNYRTALHENYYRIYAGHNTVIVNGASCSEGNWVNIGINTVQTVGMEPKPFKIGVSNDLSFTCSSFVDDKGDRAEAVQQRLMGIVRTSPTSGFYVDVFRSESKLPNQFHDYLYHNIGEKVDMLSDNQRVELNPSIDRYIPRDNSAWESNVSYQFPGWQYFDNAQVSGAISKNVLVDITAAELEKGSLKMRMFITGEMQRDYAKAMAPKTIKAPEPYNEKPTPVIVIRQNGEAWKRPFAVVYEALSANDKESTVKSVEALQMDETFAGFKVVSEIRGSLLTQYVITNDAENGAFDDSNAKISFRGRYGVVTLNDKMECISLYIGEGSDLSCQKNRMHSVSLDTTAAFASINGNKADVHANSPVELSLANGQLVKSSIPKS